MTTLDFALFYAQMHGQIPTHLPVSVDEMNFAELDALREELRLTQAMVCERGQLNISSYTRWKRWLRGEPGGGVPTRRSLKTVRDVLKEELGRIARRQLPAADGHSPPL
ncbi:hypothetical protein [Hyphomicrobium sp. 1Nfss2.1]|uniref:hypothetical protein n=1 Tax=Hyphomicrobium sp. 1Nfss2.1 TaxID=3413936 RepID=UPI003C7AA3D3